MVYQLVIDTNVLVSALKSSKGASFRLLSLIGTGKFDLNISTPLVVEYEETLKRESHHLSENGIADILDYICAVAHKHKIFYLWRPILKDPDDDFILELAVKSNAWIITYNKADFKKALNFKVKVMTPKEFLRLIGEIP